MLRAFEAFGRLGGVRKAALDLDVDHAVVSRHLRSLETYLGTALIERGAITDRWLTPDGATYHASISAGFREITDATDRLRRQNDTRLLICCSPGLAYHWLMPRLPNFATLHRRFELALRPTDLPMDFLSNEVDGDIRYLRRWEAISTRTEVRTIDLANPAIIPVASPDYLRKAEPIDTVADLLHHSLLHEDSDEEWRVWLQDYGITGQGELPGARLWHAHLSLDAALKGQGIALSNALLLGDALARGALEIVQPRNEALRHIELGRYVFVARDDRWRSPPLARFREWLAKEFEAPL